MWIITRKTDTSCKRLLLSNREYTIGRAGADLVILDCSVSRLHARISIFYPEEVVEDGGVTLPVLQITDLSRFGTFINTTKISKNIPIEISPDSEVTFGAQPGVTFKMELSPLNVLFSSVSPKIKMDLRSVICTLGGKIFPEFVEACNLLVMSKLIVTHKVLCCLLHGINIVTPEYLYVLKDSSASENFSHPDPSLYMPPIEERGFSSADTLKFRANANRCHIFAGKTFIFLSESKFQLFGLLLNLANAKSLCISEKLPLSQRYFMDLFSSESDPCLVYESGCKNKEIELAYSVLNEQFNRRPILEHEISFAIIDSSCDVYCNATCPYPVVTDGRLFNIPIECNSWNVKRSSSMINRCGSTFKRQREDLSDGGAKSDVMRSVPKRQCRRTVLLPPSIQFANLKKKPSEILVPDTEQIDTHNSLPIRDFLNENGQPAPLLSSMAKAFKVKKNNASVCVGSDDESAEDNPALEAFDSMPSFTSILNKKENASMTCSPASNSETSASERVIQLSSEENNAALKPYNARLGEFSTSPHKRNRDLQSASDHQEFIPHDKENATSTDYDPLQSHRRSPAATSGFLSKAQGQKMAFQTGSSKAPDSTGVEDLSVNIELCKLIINPSSCPPSRKQSSTEYSVVNFKRFFKVWPSCYKNAAESGREVHHHNGKKIVKVEPSVKINVVPYVPESKEEAKWRTDGPTQSGNEDAALIDQLFDEITALPRVRLR